ncbi:hypothetical protein D3C87_1160410 [compost metagenome]
MALGDQDHRGARQAVVVGSHREAIGSGSPDDQVVARRELGQGDVLDQDIPRFAALARDGDDFLGGAGEDAIRRVAGAVGDDPGVVGHAAVHRDVGAHVRNLLARSDRVDGGAGRSDDRAAGLDDQLGKREASLRAAADHRERDGLDGFGDARRIVALLVGDAEAAADVQFLDLQAVIALQLGAEVEEDLDGRHVGLDIEDLRADMRVEAAKAQQRAADDPAQGFLELAGKVEAELGVDLAGPDEVVGMRLDAGGDPEKHVGADADFLGQHGEQVQFVEVVDDETAHAFLEGVAKLFGALVVPLEVDVFGRNAGFEDREEFAAGDHLGGEAFLMDEEIDGHVAEGLARVKHLGRPRVVFPDGLQVGPAGALDGGLVEDVEGRPVGLHEILKVGASDLPAALRIDAGRHRVNHLVHGRFGKGHPNSSA